MKKAQFVFLMAAVLLLNGCAGPTMESLKTNNAGIYIIERDMPYTEAYRLTRDWALAKYIKFNVGISGWGVTSDLFAEEKFGEVGVEFHDYISGPGYYLNIQITPKDETATIIRAYYRWNIMKGDLMNLERYLDENRRGA